MKMTHFFVLFWAGITGLTLSWLHSSHYAVFSNRAPSSIEQTNQWGIVHVLGGECGCSQNVAKYLLSRGLNSDAQERVVIIGELPQESELVEKGFVVSNIKLDELEGVPMFIVHDEKGNVVHSGGYTDGMAGPLSDFQDVKTLGHLERGESVETLPVRGCAIAKKIKESLDPLGLKYKS